MAGINLDNMSIPDLRHLEMQVAAAITRTGRGRRPDWFHAARASGRSVESLEV